MKQVKTISITFTPGNPNGKDWNEKLGEGKLIPLAGEWTEERAHIFMKENYPNAHSYRLEYTTPQNDSCYWPD